VSTLADFIPTLGRALQYITPPGVDPVGFWLIFLILLAVFYTFLGRIFPKRTGSRAIVAICMAFLASLSVWSTTVITKLIPFTAIAAVIAVIILIIASILGLKGPSKWIAVLLVLFVFGMTAYTVVPMIVQNAEKFGIPVSKEFPQLVTLTETDVGIIIVLIILIVAAAWIIFGGKEEGK